MKFTFKNVSNTMTISDVEKVLNTPPHTGISPQLKQKNLNYIEPYYRDNMMKSNTLDGVLIKLPIYTGNYITLKPEEEIVIETENVLEQDFYKEVCASFNSAYPVMECKEDEPGPEPPTPSKLAVPFEVRMDEFAEGPEGENIVYYYNANGSDLVMNKNYILTVSIVGGQSATGSFTLEMSEDNFLYGEADVPNVAPFSIFNNVSYNPDTADITSGSGFLLALSTSETVETLKTVIDSFTIEESITPQPVNEFTITTDSSSSIARKGTSGQAVVGNIGNALGLEVGQNWTITCPLFDEPVPTTVSEGTYGNYFYTGFDLSYLGVVVMDNTQLTPPVEQTGEPTVESSQSNSAYDLRLIDPDSGEIIETTITFTKSE